jgi:hypothetical protein
MKLNLVSKVLKASSVVALGAVSALLSCCATAQKEQEEIFETNVTNDVNISSGEPEIAVDPTHPKRLAIIEFAIGSARAPAGSVNMQAATPEQIAALAEHNGRVMLSTDGGNTWQRAPGRPPASDPNSPVNGGGDPMIAIGPDGTIYAADEPTPPPGKYSMNGPGGLQAYLSHFHVMIAASRDGGKTFGAPQIAGTPADRPWLAVDQSNGMAYTVSSGSLNVKTGEHNVAGSDAPNDRWLIAWKPHLAGKSEPHRIGGPDFSGTGGNTITAAHGIVAATFVLGGPVPGTGFTGSPPASTPVPDSLKGTVKDGTTSCSMQAPCLFFETSTDDGQHWTRRHVPVAGGFNGQRAQVSADPGRAGRYAIGVLNPARTNFLILVTDDSGVTWSAPVTVQETTAGVDFKQWMAYGPTGVLGLMWRKERKDLTPPKPPGAPPENPVFATTGPAYDIYATVSCDGGAAWLPPMRVNAKTSPSGAPGRDDLSYIALDTRSAHLVWGDHRMPAADQAPNEPPNGKTIQAYYGRVPFSVMSKGTACGRK